MERVVDAVFWYVTFLFSTTVHEAAHAWCARLGGDLTAYHEGQVSLDPLPHMRREPIGMIVLPLISLFVIHWPFGYASAPYDPLWADRHTRRAGLMSLAGPLSNLLLVVLAGTLIRVGTGFGVFQVPESVAFTGVAQSVVGRGVWPGAAFFLSLVFSLNLILALLNILPLPPLDGSGAVTLLMSEDHARAFRRFMGNPAFGWIGLLLAWQLFDPLFGPVFTASLNMLYPGSHFR